MAEDNYALFKYFQSLWEEHSEDGKLLIVSKPKALSYFKRYAKWMGLKEGKRLIDFVFENWDAIRRELKISNQLPSYNLFGTDSFVQRFKEIKEKGFTVDTKTRGEGTSGPKKGW